jgi:DGQHR domain-containing protein
MRDREKLETSLKQVLDIIKHNRKKTEEIKEGLLKNKIMLGESQKLINGQIPLEELDARVLCLLAIETRQSLLDIDDKEKEKLGLTLLEDQISVEHYFSPVEIKKSKTYEEVIEDAITLPYTLHNVTQINPDQYVGIITAQEIKKLFDAGLLEYDFAVQREAKFQRDRKDPNNIIKKVNINPKAVKEISKHIKDGTLISSALTFNAKLGSSEEGEELLYISKDRTLTITAGTEISVLDGFHRVTSVVETLTAFPDLDMNFVINIVNFGQKQAQEFFSQLNSATPVSQSRLKEMKQARQSDFIAKQLQINSELKGKVSSSEHVSAIQKHLVSFGVLSDAIDETFNVKNKPEAMEVADYLTEFFDSLLLKNPEAFITEVDKVKETSLINANQMFYGYVVLAYRMQQEGIRLTKLQSIIENIDFNRDNKLWHELGIVEDNGNIKSNAKNRIKQYFKNLNLDEVISRAV